MLQAMLQIPSVRQLTHNKKVKRTLLVVLASGLIITGVRAYLFKDYVTVLRYPKNTATLFVSRDSSITITSFLYVENSRTLGAVINFETLPDSLLLENLNVIVYSVDNPKQSIQLKNVSTIVHPVSISSDYLDHLEVNNFSELPVFYKTIRNSGLPYNKITFYFKTRQIEETDFYNFKIQGKFIYKGQPFSFYKDIRTERKLEYHPYRMMN